MRAGVSNLLAQGRGIRPIGPGTNPVELTENLFKNGDSAVSVESATMDLLERVPIGMHIAGSERPASSGMVTSVYDPGKAVIIAEVASGTGEDVDLAVAEARKSFEAGYWRNISPAERGAILWRTSMLMEERRDDLARLESLNVGLPLPDAYKMVGEAIAAFRYYAGFADKIHGRTLEVGPGDSRVHAYTLREPVGVAGLIASWNAPLIVAAQKLAPALAAGCSCVLKPASETPLTAIMLVGILEEAGVPAGVVNLVLGRGSTVGSAIASHPDVDKVSFTGSTEVGKQIIYAATGNLKKLTLELGGKSPVIVLDDAELDKVIPEVARAVFYNAGQICTAGTRLYVHKAVYQEVVEGVAQVSKALRVGYGTDPDAEVGPLVSEKQLQTVKSYVTSGIADGARVAAGGAQVDREGFFYEPTVLADVHQDMKVVREEIFGPVLSAMPFREIDEAVAYANDTEYGLAASVWSRDIGRAHAVSRRIRAGRVGVNLHRAGGIYVPQGGYRQSGWGRDGSFEGLDAYLETKSVLEALDR